MSYVLVYRSNNQNIIILYYKFDIITHNTHMKKLIPLCLICVIFFVALSSFGVTYCFENEHIEFYHNGRIFTYSLEENIKKSNIFSTDFEINKFNRFGSTNERINLLNKMLNLGFNKEIALNYLFPNLTKKINSISKNVYISPKDATLKTNTSSEKVFQIASERKGKELDKNKLFENIISACVPLPVCIINKQGKVLCASNKINEVFLYDRIVDGDFFTLTGVKTLDLYDAAETKIFPVINRNDKKFKLVAQLVDESEDSNLAVFFNDVTALEDLKDEQETK